MGIWEQGLEDGEARGRRGGCRGVGGRAAKERKPRTPRFTIKGGLQSRRWRGYPARMSPKLPVGTEKLTGAGVFWVLATCRKYEGGWGGGGGH